MGKDYRKYRDGSLHHVFCKEVDGNILFYSVQDCIFYLTLYYVLAKRYGIKTLAFGIMPNHVHSFERAPSLKKFNLFHCRLNSEFTQGYNKQHNRSGAVFMKPFGYAPKTVGKVIRDCISYIANNPVAGNQVSRVEESKWNLVGYWKSDHPFSEKIQLEKVSRRMRRAVEKLRQYHRDNCPLDYTRQRELFKELTSKEKYQLIDRIVSMYNCLDYDAAASYYNGDFANAIISISANSGKEHDVPDDYEDYSVYNKMIQIATSCGIDPLTCNYENSPADMINYLKNLFRKAGFQARQIQKFLHLKR